MKQISAKHLQLELDRLRTENARLHAALRIHGRHASRIQRAYDAALLLATWHCGYLLVTRADAIGRGMTQRQWENGIALLKLARVYDGRRWSLHDLADIEARLTRAAERASEVPEAFFALQPALSQLSSCGASTGARCGQNGTETRVEHVFCTW